MKKKKKVYVLISVCPGGSPAVGMHPKTLMLGLSQILLRHYAVSHYLPSLYCRQISLIFFQSVSERKVVLALIYHSKQFGIWYIIPLSRSKETWFYTIIVRSQLCILLSTIIKRSHCVSCKVPSLSGLNCFILSITIIWWLKTFLFLCLLGWLVNFFKLPHYLYLL